MSSFTTLGSHAYETLVAPETRTCSNVEIVRVVVDLEVCESNARCVATAPDVFRLGEDDVLRVLMERPPEELRAGVVRAAKRCPKGAIRVDD